MICMLFDMMTWALEIKDVPRSWKCVYGIASAMGKLTSKISNLLFLNIRCLLGKTGPSVSLIVTFRECGRKEGYILANGARNFKKNNAFILK